MDNSIIQQNLFFQEQIERLKKGVDLKKLKLAVEELNKHLKRKRKVIIVRKWSQFKKEVKIDSLSRLKDELMPRLLPEISNQMIDIRVYFRCVEFIEAGLWSRLENELFRKIEVPSSMIWEPKDNIFIVFVNKFFPHLKVFSENKRQLECLKKIVEAGNCYFMVDKKNLFVIPFPEKIKLDEKMRLHSETGPALVWLNNKSYWLKGIKFRKKLWQKIVSRTIPTQEAIRLENIEERIIALQYIGGERLIKDLGGRLKAKDKYGELIELTNLKDTQGKNWLIYKAIDPSKNEFVYLRVHPDCKTPKEAMTRAYRLFLFNLEYFPDLRT